MTTAKQNFYSMLLQPAKAASWRRIVSSPGN
jgi:hypothetical protein